MYSLPSSDIQVFKLGKYYLVKKCNWQNSDSCDDGSALPNIFGFVPKSCPKNEKRSCPFQ